MKAALLPHAEQLIQIVIGEETNAAQELASRKKSLSKLVSSISSSSSNPIKSSRLTGTASHMLSSTVGHGWTLDEGEASCESVELHNAIIYVEHLKTIPSVG
jgi:hypothetical protein